MKHSRALRFHASMLNDTKRTEAFRDAIMQVVKEGDVVVDVGCGSGILSFFACQAGARRVYAIDSQPIIHTARELALANGFADRITFLEGHSHKLDVPEQADVIISETLWNFGLGEDILPTMHDAQNRWLKPGGQIIPESFEMLMAPVELGDLYDSVGVVDAYGLNLTPFRQKAYSGLYTAQIKDGRVIAPIQVVMEIDLRNLTPGPITMNGEFVIEREATLHWFMGCFRAVLAEGIEVENVPPNSMPNWGQAFFPMQEPVGVKVGDHVTVEFQTYFRNDKFWTWMTEVRDDDGVKVSYKQSTMNSRLDMLEIAKNRMRHLEDD